MTFEVLNFVVHRVLGIENFNTCLDVVAPATSLFDRNTSPKNPKDKAGAAGTSLVGSAPAVLAIHNAGIGLLHEGMREIAVVPWFSLGPYTFIIFRPKLITCAVCCSGREVLLACGEMQRQCLDLKLDAQRSIASASSSAPHISYSKYADFLDEATCNRNSATWVDYG